MKTSIRGHGMLLFIGVLLPDRVRQDNGPDAISNQSLDPVSVGAWWIFGWRVVSPARPGLHEEDESGMASAGHWAASEKGGGRPAGPLGLGWVTCGIDWPAGLFAGAGRDERWAGVKAVGPCTEK
jgi:hypothetical protein